MWNETFQKKAIYYIKILDNFKSYILKDLG